jgi:hypothetical protein
MQVAHAILFICYDTASSAELSERLFSWQHAVNGSGMLYPTGTGSVLLPLCCRLVKQPHHLQYLQIGMNSTMIFYWLWDWSHRKLGRCIHTCLQCQAADLGDQRWFSFRACQPMQKGAAFWSAIPGYYKYIYNNPFLIHYTGSSINAYSIHS